MRLGRLYTIPLQDHSAEVPEIGMFDLEVNVDDLLFQRTHDKPGLVRSTISLHLAANIHDLQVPQEYWRFESDPVLVANMNFPRGLNFGVLA